MFRDLPANPARSPARDRVLPEIRVVVQPDLRPSEPQACREEDVPAGDELHLMVEDGQFPPSISCGSSSAPV